MLGSSRYQPQNQIEIRNINIYWDISKYKRTQKLL